MRWKTIHMTRGIVKTVLFLCTVLTAESQTSEESIQGKCEFEGVVTKRDLESLQSLVGQRFSAGDAEEHGIQYDVGICITAWPEEHLPPVEQYQTAGIIRHLKHPQPGEDNSYYDSYVKVLGNMQRAALYSDGNSLTLEYNNDKFTSCSANDIRRTVFTFHCSPNKSLMSLIKWQLMTEKEDCFLQFDLHHQAACSVEPLNIDAEARTYIWAALAIVGSLIAVVSIVGLIVLLVLRRRSHHNPVYRYSQFTSDIGEEWEVRKSNIMISE